MVVIISYDQWETPHATGLFRNRHDAEAYAKEVMMLEPDSYNIVPITSPKGSWRRKPLHRPLR